MSHKRTLLKFFAVAALLPVVEQLLPSSYRFAQTLQPIFIFCLLGVGLNVLTGYVGMLHLGVAGFMGLGAYSYAILTCDIYPFQLSLLPALLCVMTIGVGFGVLLAIPTLRLTGDYLAIVTLGFGEIMQSVLRNVDTITKGTQGINPLPPPSVGGFRFDPLVYQPWYYLFLFILFAVVGCTYRLEHSRIGRAWIAIREDELASRCMGIPVVRMKLLAMGVCSAVCALAGAAYAILLLTSAEPSTYDFQFSIMALCMVILGGIGSLSAVLLGGVVMVGFNSILLSQVTKYLINSGWVAAGSVFLSPANWKYLIFGLALILMMRFKPDGLFSRLRSAT